MRRHVATAEKALRTPEHEFARPKRLIVRHLAGVRSGVAACAALIEAVVGLGSNLFYGTSIPAAVLFIDRNKPPARKGKVLIVALARASAVLSFDRAPVQY